MCVKKQVGGIALVSLFFLFILRSVRFIYFFKIFVQVELIYFHIFQRPHYYKINVRLTPLSRLCSLVVFLGSCQRSRGQVALVTLCILCVCVFVCVMIGHSHLFVALSNSEGIFLGSNLS